MHSPALLSAVLVFTASTFSSALPKGEDDPAGETHWAISRSAFPSPVQPHIIKSCTVFHPAEKGDICQGITERYGVTLTDFYWWNPDVGKNCDKLLAGYNYCFGVGKDTNPPHHKGQPPNPDHGGGCGKNAVAGSQATCQTMADQARISVDEFLKLNPSIKSCNKVLEADHTYCVAPPAAFNVRTRYHPDCTGVLHDDRSVARDSDGICINTDCKVGSLDIPAVGDCPKDKVQVSYWQQPDCQGDWYGYNYTSRGQCFRLWNDGWFTKSLHLRCPKKDDCLATGECTKDLAKAPPKGICM